MKREGEGGREEKASLVSQGGRSKERAANGILNPGTLSAILHLWGPRPCSASSADS